MRRIPPKLRLLAACAVVAAAIVGYLSFRTSTSRDMGPVIARVDGTSIYLAQAKARVEGLSSVHGDVETTLGTDWPEQVMQSLVDDVIVRDEAVRRGLAVSDADLAETVQGIREDFPSEEAFDKWLGEQGMSPQELERRVELNMLSTRLYVDLTADMKIPNDEIRDYYREHRADFEGPDGTPPLLEVRTQIREDLLKQAQDGAFGVWLEQQRQNVNVVIVLEDWWRRV